MTNQEQIAAWHADKPEWAKKLTAGEWNFAEFIAHQLDVAQAPEPTDCPLPKDGWYCTREKGHEGPCAAYFRE